MCWSGGGDPAEEEEDEDEGREVCCGGGEKCVSKRRSSSGLKSVSRSSAGGEREVDEDAMIRFEVECLIAFLVSQAIDTKGFCTVPL